MSRKQCENGEVSVRDGGNRRVSIRHVGEGGRRREREGAGISNEERIPGLLEQTPWRKGSPMLSSGGEPSPSGKESPMLSSR